MTFYAVFCRDLSIVLYRKLITKPLGIFVSKFYLLCFKKTDQIKLMDEKLGKYNNSRELLQIITIFQIRTFFIILRFQVLRENLNDGNISVKDVSVYTGLSGIALMLIKLEKSQILKDKIDFSLKDLAFKITKHNDSKKSSAFTYLCGAPGALYVKALSGAEAKSLEPKNLKDILDLGSSLCHSGSGAYDEYLYGRAGYLGCLVFMAKSFPTQKDELVMDKICQAMIDSGVNSAKRNRLSE